MGVGVRPGEGRGLSEEATIKRLRAARRLLAIKKSHDSFYDFMRLMLPDELDPEDATLSEYKDTRHGRLLCDLVEKIEKGDVQRFAVSIPPQHGKTWHMSLYGPAWILGRNPRAKIILATYNETRADELGEDFRKAITSAAYRQVFPDVELAMGSKSKSAMTTTRGGKIFFVGQGGTVTGRGAQYFFIDDPIKDDKEVQSAQFREDMWKWFFSVAYSRGSKRTRMGIIHTRWNQDDLIGRLCDPDHPERNKRFAGIAQDWLYLNISGVITDPKLAAALGLKLEVQTDPQIIRAFGTKPMAALWADDKDLAHFARWKTGESDTFGALVMGQPGADDGDYFKAEWLIEYSEDELPDNLVKYGASDHALSVKKGRDYTCIGCVGVDAQDVIWVLPDIVWDRMDTLRQVDEMLMLMQTHDPAYWWAEGENIAKSIGPFLHKRMEEKNIYVPIDEVSVSQDKRVMGRAIQGRMAMKKVRFPRFAPWWADAKNQLLRFDKAPHDDFVSFLSHIGLGMMKQFRPSEVEDKTEVDNVVPMNSRIAKILKDTRARAEREKREAGSRGW